MSEPATTDAAASEETKTDASEAAKTSEAAKKENTEADKTKNDESGDGKKVDEEAAVAAVAERLCFFFSNANIRQDGYVRSFLLKDDPKLPIEELLKFNTIKRHTTDAAIVVKAAKSERASSLVEVTEDSLAIKRVNPFTKDQMDDNIPLTLVVDNIPTKTEENNKVFYAVTVEDIRKLFDQYGEVAMVKLRFKYKSSKDPDEDMNPEGPNKKGRRVPRQSALVEFEEEASLKAAAEDVLTKKDGAEVEPKRKLELAGNTLSAMLMREFLDGLKKRKAEAEPDKDAEEKDEAGDEDGEKGDGENGGFTIDWKPGCVLKLKQLPGSCDREALLEAVSKCLGKTLDEIKELKIYVDYSRGQPDGAIRFTKPEDGVKETLDKLKSGEVEVAGSKVEDVALLEGDEEKKYWTDFMEFKSKQLRQRSSGGNKSHKRHKKKQRRS